jgi:hypothetical protein
LARLLVEYDFYIGKNTGQTKREPPVTDQIAQQEASFTRQLTEMGTRPRIFGRMTVVRAAGFKLTVGGETRLYAIASETATAMALGRHTGNGTPAR